MFLATYYNNKLISMKKEFQRSGDVQTLALNLKRIEKNILFCMKELFNIDYYEVVASEEKRKFSGQS